MARLDAKWNNFWQRGQTWYHFWQDTPTASSPVNIDTFTGELIVSSVAPTVTVTDNKPLNPDSGSLVLSGFAPTVVAQQNVFLYPDNGQLVLLGYSPTVVVTTNADLFPGSGQVLITGFAPTVVTSENQHLFPGSSQLLLEGFAPDITIFNGIVVTETGELIVTGAEPIVSISSSFLNLADGVGKYNDKNAKLELQKQILEEDELILAYVQAFVKLL